MTETEKNKEADSRTEDWAIIPFDEAEDDARWAQLSAEMDGLIEEVTALEEVHGTILMENDLSQIQAEEILFKDEMAEDELF